MNECRFELKSHLSELVRLTGKLANFGRLNGLSKKCIFQINLCLDELLTNIISYGYKDSCEHSINITISKQEDMLTLSIEDDGIPFNPEKLDKPHLCCEAEKREIGGLGVHFVKEMMDAVNYQRCAGKNKLTLKKTITEEDPAIAC